MPKRPWVVTDRVYPRDFAQGERVIAWPNTTPTLMHVCRAGTTDLLHDGGMRMVPHVLVRKACDPHDTPSWIPAHHLKPADEP
jgi:hypothetical protein